MGGALWNKHTKGHVKMEYKTFNIKGVQKGQRLLHSEIHAGSLFCTQS